MDKSIKDLRSRQLNPEHENYYKVRGLKEKPKNVKQINKTVKTKKNEKSSRFR